MSTIKPTWSSDTWITFDGLEPNAEYEFDSKTQTLKRTDRPMKTIYQFESKHLGQAFMKELVELGYKNTGYEFDEKSDKTIKDYFGGEGLKSVGFDYRPEYTKGVNTFQLETQWNEALQHATEQLQPKFEAKDKVVYIDGEVYEVVRVKDNGVITITANSYVVHVENSNSLRFATQEEIEQATRKTFFQWEVTETNEGYKIGCSEFTHGFLRKFYNAISNLHGDKTVREVWEEMERAELVESDLPF